MGNQITSSARRDSLTNSIRNIPAFGETSAVLTRLPISSLRIASYEALLFHQAALKAFLNLKVLKLIDVHPKNSASFREKILEPVLLLLPRLACLKLSNIKLATKLTDFDWNELLSALLSNRSLKKLSLVNLGLGNDCDARMGLATVVLYHDSLVSLNLKNNNLIKLKPLIENLVRNGNSNILKLNLSQNSYDEFDFSELLRLIDMDSVFGKRQYFKLRYVCLSNCKKLAPIEAKLQEKLDSFYLTPGKQRKTLISYKNKEA